MYYRVKLTPLSIKLSTNYRLMEGAQDFVLKSLFCVVCLQQPWVERAGTAVWNGDGWLFCSCRHVSLGVLVVRRRPCDPQPRHVRSKAGTALAVADSEALVPFMG